MLVLLGSLASPALADDKLENPSAVAAPSAPDGTADPLANLPKKCEPFVKRMATPNATIAMSARISLATCMADVRLAPLELLDTQESMLEVEAAIAPSFGLLDDVIARGDQQHQLLAHHAKMIVVQQAATRMLASVPPAAQPTVEAAQLRDSRRALVEQMIQPWRQQIADEARAANAIAKANPALAKNASVAIALRDTKKAAPDAIATAEAARRSPDSDARPAGTAEDTLR
ncbi:MAG: hypothetical protein AB7T06_46995 [Kofleriaceae bacterium]